MSGEKKDKKMEKKNSEEVLKMMIKLLLPYIDELATSKKEGRQFEYGEKLAYTECLEWIQKWEYAECYGLNCDIEKRYPL